MKKCKNLLVMLLTVIMMINTASITVFASTNDPSLNGLYDHFIEPLPTKNAAAGQTAFYDQWASAGHQVPGLLNFINESNTAISQDAVLNNGATVGFFGNASRRVLLVDGQDPSASISVDNDEWSLKFSTQDGTDDSGNANWYMYDSLMVLNGDNGNLNLGGQSDSKIGFQYDFKYENPNENVSNRSYSGLTYSTGLYGNLLAVAGYGGAEFYTGGQSQYVESFRPVLQADKLKYTMCYGGRSVLKNDAFSQECFAGDKGLEYGRWYTMRVIFDCINTKMNIYIFKDDGTLYITREITNVKYKNIQPGFRLASCPLLDTYFKNVYIVREGMYVKTEPVIETNAGKVTATADVRMDAKVQGVFNQGIGITFTPDTWALKSPSLILALYSKADGRMLDSETASLNTMNFYGIANELTVTLDEPSEEYYAKAFIWRDMDNLIPYIHAVKTPAE